MKAPASAAALRLAKAFCIVIFKTGCFIWSNQFSFFSGSMDRRIKGMVRVLRLLAMAAVLSFSTAQAAMTAVRSEGDLDFLIMEMSMALEESRTFDLGGFVMQDKMSELLETSNSGDFCSTWRYTYPSAKGPVTLQLEYLDSTRVLAAVLNPKLRKVPTLERRAAAEVKKRMERYKFTGMTRKEIAKAVYDDLLLRSRVIYNGSVKNPCTNLLLRNKGDMTAFSRCLFVMLMAQDIPCRGTRSPRTRTSSPPHRPT
jgi:hypothetical protein